MNLTEELTRLIISSIHGVSYEEAVNLEMYTKNRQSLWDCLLHVKDDDGNVFHFKHQIFEHLFEKISDGKCIHKEIKSKCTYKIIGLPITIDRCAVIVEDKHYLIDNWRLGENGRAGTLENQPKELQEWIFSNRKSLISN